MALLMDVIRDARYGARLLLRSPGSSAIAVVTLALGIGVTSAVFTIVNAVLFRPLPFHDPDRLVAVIAVPDERAGFHPVQNASFADLQGLPAVAAATTHSTYPPVTLSGAGDPVRLRAAFVSADFHQTLGVLPMLGPGLAPGEEGRIGPAVVRSERLWRARFGADPAVIGRSATVDGVLRTVVANVVRQEISEPREPMLYLPLSLGIEGLFAFADGLDHMQYVVRATGEQRAILEGMRAVLRASDPGLPTGSVTTLDDLVTASEGERLFEAQLLAASAAAALALAMIGVYGVSAHAVHDRTHEIAVRMALGARGATVTAMVLRQTLMLVLPGLMVGSLASLMATRVIEGSLYGVAPADPVTYAGVALLLGAVAMAAVLVPLRRAIGINPAAVLRA
jgi:putative ABC transport system permease protein